MSSSLRWWFGSLIALLMLAAVLRFLLAQNLAADFDQALVEIEVAQGANNRVLQSLTDVETGVREYRLTRDRSFLQPAIDGRRDYSTAIEESIQHAPDARSRQLLLAVRDSADTWLSRYAAPVMATEPDDLTSSTDVAKTGKELFGQVRTQNAAVAHALDMSRADALQDVRDAMRTAALIGAFLSLVAAVMALFVAWRASRMLLGPLHGLRRMLTQVSAGDRAARATESGPPEMQNVIHSFNEMCDESDRNRASEQRRMRMQMLAHEIGARLRDSLERGAVLDEVAHALGSSLELDRVYVQLGNGGQLPIAQQWCRPDVERLDEQRAYPQLVDRVIRADAPGEDPVRLATGCAAYISTPFGFEDTVFGTVVTLRSAAYEWQSDDVALVDSVCADLGRAFQHVRLYEHERRLVERLRDVDQHKTDFIATVSHELRTPLTSVLGYLEVLTSGDQGPLSDRQMRSLRIIERNAERLGDMVADLLTLSRIESGTFALELGAVRLRDAVHRAAEGLGPVAVGMGLELDLDVPADLWVTADQAQLQRIVVNLLGNAIKFSPPGGQIAISARGEDEGMVALHVRDTGGGIPDSEQNMVFEPFQRGSNAVANATQGPGLGLAVVRQIVEQHHGRVVLISKPGEGTIVTVRLPRVSATPEALEAPEAIASTS